MPLLCTNKHEFVHALGMNDDVDSGETQIVLFTANRIFSIMIFIVYSLNFFFQKLV